MGVDREFLWHYMYSHSDDDGYTEEFTETVSHSIIPGNLTIHAGLSHVQATTEGPYGAACGLVSVTKLIPEVGDWVKEFHGNDPAGWPPAASGEINAFTIGLHVTRGAATLWYFFQVWE